MMGGEIMHRIFHAGICFCIVVMATLAQAPPQEIGSLKPIERFDGKATIETKAGKPMEAHVVIRVWQIHGRQRIERFPEEGFMIVALHSGRVITAIGGKREERKGGDFWTVPTGSSMSVEVTSESALLETTALRKK
jgi:hypothetical protein